MTSRHSCHMVLKPVPEPSFCTWQIIAITRQEASAAEDPSGRPAASSTALSSLETPFSLDQLCARQHPRRWLKAGHKKR